ARSREEVIGIRIHRASKRPPPRSLRRQPVAVASEVHRANLLPRLADQIALADEHFICVEADRLALRAVAPANDRSAAGERAGRQILEAEDLLDDRVAGVHGYRAYPRGGA